MAEKGGAWAAKRLADEWLAIPTDLCSCNRVPFICDINSLGPASTQTGVECDVKLYTLIHSLLIQTSKADALLKSGECCFAASALCTLCTSQPFATLLSYNANMLIQSLMS